MIEQSETMQQPHGVSECINDHDTVVKARLVEKIGEIIKTHQWSQQEASEVLGIPQSRLSQILRGQLRGISEARLIECLVKLGRDVQIVVGKPRSQAHVAQLKVVFQK